MLKVYGLKVRYLTFEVVVGFLVPLGLFLEAGSPIILATSSIAQGSLSLPVSFIVLPLVFIVGLFRGSRTIEKKYKNLVFLSAPFFIYSVLFSLLFSLDSSSTSPFLYGIQWIQIFLWLPYFMSLRSNLRQVSFLKGFTLGAFFTVFYYALSGVLEIIVFGALLDNGRLSQNLMLPGQYQIAVYIPTLIAISSGVVNAAYHLSLIKLSKLFIYLFNLLAFIAVFFLAAREGIVVILFSIIAIYSIGSRRKAIAFVLVIITLITIGVISFDAIIAYMADSELRAFRKIANSFQSGQSFAGRDTVILDVLQIFKADPLFGSRFSPPNNTLGVTAPSAHNMYVDVFIWTGAIGGGFFTLFAFWVFIRSFYEVLKSFTNSSWYFSQYAAALLLIILVISNNINVPMRQPVLAPLLAFLLISLTNYNIFKKQQTNR